MAQSLSSPQRVQSALFCNRNVPSPDDEQDFKGDHPFAEELAGGLGSHGDEVSIAVVDDDVSEGGSSSSKTKSGGSEGSPSSGTTGGLSRIVGHDIEEDRRICGARCLFFFVLMVASVSLGTMVYLITNQDANYEFENEFINSSMEVTKIANERIKLVFENLQKISLTITSLIQDGHNKTEHPTSFIHLPGVEHHFALFREFREASFIGYTPIVPKEDLDRWVNYSKVEAEEWLLENPQDVDLADPHEDDQRRTLQEVASVKPYVWKYLVFDDDGQEIVADDLTCQARIEIDLDNFVHVVETKFPSNPLWYYSPPLKASGINAVNFNVRSEAAFRDAFEIVEATKLPTFRDICPSAKWFQMDTSLDTITLVVPVFENFVDAHLPANATVVGHLFAMVPWVSFFKDMLVEDTEEIAIRISSLCGTDFRVIVHGAEADIINAEKWDSSYDHMFYSRPYGDFVSTSCNYTLTTYPTAEFEEEYVTNVPWIYVGIVLSFMFVTCCGFLIFDQRVFSRQQQLIDTATKQNAIVSSLFPKSIHKQLMEEMETPEGNKKNNKSGTAHLRSYLMEEASSANQTKIGSDSVLPSKPIADLFPDTTIMFADIAGFTAWSSVREPAQVFTLLESIYRKFDSIAKRRRVFKVEVVGDCYVAVAGLPDPRLDHALVMAKFAKDCINAMRRVCASLEVSLGPDTTELLLRVGMHSGPVVAGVLRGDRSRFQLFGDTMNTASRMESTGVPGRIQVSKETATLLMDAGKQDWLVQRENKVQAKGKGELTTFFLEMDSSATDSASQVNNGSDHDSAKDELLFGSIVNAQEEVERRNRTAEWTVDVLVKILKSLVAKRRACGIKLDSEDVIAQLERQSLSQNHNSKTVIDEVAEMVVLPGYRASNKNTNDHFELEDKIVMQLRHYVQTIASLYNDNPFHNFDHANHVVMSVNKLLSRINAPDLDVDADGKMLYDHTYGITSDPLTWFACVFSALIHDVDHSGAPNAQLVKEGAPVAKLYKGKSIAEQNSFDIAWDLLMEPVYKESRRLIYATAGEFKRFRQLVVNSVMATDIVDKDLKKLRNDRWDVVFSQKSNDDSNSSHIKDMKATIVIEHLIQASDVAHTMQHWHVYRRWNERFFWECYQAYLDGRSETNPAETWYKGEIGFFDYYIIPLAKKLKECGVFGVSSDEYLSYALQNRNEWEQRGEDLVAEMVKRARRRDQAKQRLGLNH